MATGGGVIPGGRVDAGVGEVLVGLIAQQPQEGELDRAQRVVTDPESATQRGVPRVPCKFPVSKHV